MTLDTSDLERRIIEIEARLLKQEIELRPEHELKILQEKIEFIEHELARIRSTT